MESSETEPGATPLERHQAKTDHVVLTGDEAAIKGLYVELGRDFWDAARRGAVDDVPVLSAPETLPVVLAGLAPVSGLVLDAGCGPNPVVAIRLGQDEARSVVALDLGWGMVRTATSVAAEHGVSLLGVAGDVEHLPFRAHAFDGLVCDDTIEHLPHDRSGVAELARVLAPTGRALLATPNRHSAAVISARVRDLAKKRRRPARDYFVASSHLREYTWPQFQRLVQPHLRIDRRRPVGWTEGRRRKALSRIIGLPGVWRLSQMIVLECRPR